MGNIVQDELWTEAVEGWADRRVMEYLDQHHEGYKKLWERSGSICEKYPVIDSLVSGEGEVKLTAEEHGIFIEYLDMKDMLRQLEKEYHFYSLYKPIAEDKWEMRRKTFTDFFRINVFGKYINFITCFLENTSILFLNSRKIKENINEYV